MVADVKRDCCHKRCISW